MTPVDLNDREAFLRFARVNDKNVAPVRTSHPFGTALGHSDLATDDVKFEACCQFVIVEWKNNQYYQHLNKRTQRIEKKSNSKQSIN